MGFRSSGHLVIGFLLLGYGSAGLASRFAAMGRSFDTFNLQLHTYIPGLSMTISGYLGQSM